MAGSAGSQHVFSKKIWSMTPCGGCCKEESGFCYCLPCTSCVESILAFIDPISVTFNMSPNSFHPFDGCHSFWTRHAPYATLCHWPFTWHLKWARRWPRHWPDSHNWATAPALEELEDGLGGWGVEAWNSGREQRITSGLVSFEQEVQGRKW